MLATPDLGLFDHRCSHPVASRTPLSASEPLPLLSRCDPVFLACCERDADSRIRRSTAETRCPYGIAPPSGAMIRRVYLDVGHAGLLSVLKVNEVLWRVE